MKIIISEEQYKILQEQIAGGILNMPETGQEVTGLVGKETQLQKDYSDADKVKNLFTLARKWKSTPQDWKNISTTAQQMYKQLSGAGSGTFLNELAKIKTTNQLAALVKNWVYDKQNLYTWLSSEYGISWSQIVQVLRKNFNKYIVNRYTPKQSLSA
jgi:hypothetical protein